MVENVRRQLGVSGYLAGILALALAWAYWPAISNVVSAWWSNPDYTHGFIVIPLAVWILVQRRNECPESNRSFAWVGLGWISLAAAIKIASGRLYLPELDAWSLPFWLFGTVWFLWGPKIAFWASPGIGFLWFAMPLPGTIEGAISGPLQHLAAQLSGFSLRLIGQPAITEGTTVLINEHILDIERACSGLRMFYGVAALCVGTIAVSRPAAWKSIVILLSAAPVAIFANVLRITVTGLLVLHVSGEAAQKFSHDFAGLVMIPVGLGLFLAILCVLQFFERKFEIPEGKEKSPGIRWVLGSSLAIALLVGGIVWLGQEQRQRVAITLLETSRRFESEEKWPEAVNYLNRYALARPDDKEAMVRLAEISQKTAQDRRDYLRSIDLNVRAWESNSDRLDLLQYAITSAMLIQEYEKAADLANRGVSAGQDSMLRGDLIQAKADALSQYMTWDRAGSRFTWQEVILALEEAIRLPNSPVRNYAELAEAYHRGSTGTSTISEARQKSAPLLDRLVSERPNSSNALLARFLYHEKYAFDDTSQVEGAEHEADLKRAVELAKKHRSVDDVPTLLFSASRKYALGNRREAIDLLQIALEISPDSSQASMQLADWHVRGGDSEGLQEAEETLHRAIAASSQQDPRLELQLASVYIEQRRYSEAEELIAPIEEVLPRVVDAIRWPISLQIAMLRAKITAGRQGTREAIATLQPAIRTLETRQSVRDDPRLMSRAWIQLGEYFAITDSLDQAAEAYRQAGVLDPDQPGIKLLQANIALKLGDQNDAQNSYEALLTQDNENEVALLGLAMTSLQQEIRRPKQVRNWARTQAFLERASASGANAEAVTLLRSNLSEAQGDREGAIRLLNRWVQDNPESAEAWKALATVRQRDGEEIAALEAADQYVALSAQRDVAVRLKAGLHLAQGNPDAGKKLLEDYFNAAAPEEKSTATITYAEYLSRIGEAAESERVMVNAFDTIEMNKLPLAKVLAESAWQKGDWTQLEKIETWLHESEGPDGAWWRAARAHRLIASASSTSSSAFNEAIGLVNELKRLRPRWPKGHFLQGELAMRLNQAETAVEAYKNAWQLGGREAVLADRILDLLTRSGRFEEVQLFINEVRDYLEVSDRLFDRAVPFYARSNRDDALQIARNWAEQDPKNPEHHLRLGRVFMILAQSQSGEERDTLNDQAEAEFKTAIELGPTDVSTWISAILFYSRQLENREGALTLLRDFSQQIEIDPLERAFVMAQVYESEGMRNEARLSYHQAIQLVRRRDSQEEPRVHAHVKAHLLTHAARFYSADELLLAEKYAREAFDIQPDNPFSRNVLLNVLVNNTHADSIKNAFEVLERDGKISPESLSPQDRRLAVAFLIRRSSKDDFAMASELLERSLEKSNEDIILLARAYEEQGRVAPAWELLSQLISQREARARDLVEFLRFWQAHFVIPGDLEQDGSRFQRLAKQAYGQLATLPTGRKLVLAWKLREAHATRNDDTLSVDDVMLAWKDSLDTLRVTNEAILADRGLAFELFQALIEEGQAATACRIASESTSGPGEPNQIAALTQAFMVTDPLNHGHIIAEKFFKRRLEDFSSDFKDEHISLIGDYFFLQGKYKTAVKFYRQVLADGHRDAAVENNLALALMEMNEDRAEAWSTFNNAIDTHGVSSELLDTKATLELIGDQLDSSRQTLHVLLSQQPHNAGTNLHMAMVLEAQGRHSEAQDYFLRSLALGIRSQWLSPRDRQFLRDFEERNRVELISTEYY